MTGRGFVNSEQLACGFASNWFEVVVAQYVNDTMIICTTPPSTLAQVVYVSVTNNNEAYSQTRLRFLYHEPPTIESTAKEVVWMSEYTPLTLYGSGFMEDDDLGCRLDSKPLAMHWISYESVMCIVPPQLTFGAATISATNNGQHWGAGYPIYVGVKPPLLLTAVSPDKGWADGGQVITVTGLNFHNSSLLSCRFRDASGTVAYSVRATYLSATSMQCVTPPFGAEGHAVLSVANDASNSSAYRGELAFLVEPVAPSSVTMLVPNHGLASGGTPVMVWAEGIVRSDTLACQFGTQVVPATWIGPKQVECLAPPHSPPDGELHDAGCVQLALSNSGRTFTTAAALSYEYQAIPPTVTAIAPESGALKSTTLVTVSGFGFYAESPWTCAFGTQVVPAQRVSNTKLLCVAPPGSGLNPAVGQFLAGHGSPTGWIAVPVEVSPNTRDWSNDAVAFTYDAAMSLDAATAYAGASTEEVHDPNAAQTLKRLGNEAVTTKTLVVPQLECEARGHCYCQADSLSDDTKCLAVGAVEGKAVCDYIGGTCSLPVTSPKGCINDGYCWCAMSPSGESCQRTEEECISKRFGKCWRPQGTPAAPAAQSLVESS